MSGNFRIRDHEDFRGSVSESPASRGLEIQVVGATGERKISYTHIVGIHHENIFRLAVAPDEAEAVIQTLKAEQVAAYASYEKMIEQGVARELARTNLPISLYTEWYWQIDLHNLFHFLRLRLDGHAQYEIRVYAEAMAQCAKAVAPIAFEAFEEHLVGSVDFSRSECAALAARLRGEPIQLEGKALERFEAKLAHMLAANAPDDAPEEPQLPV